MRRRRGLKADQLEAGELLAVVSSRDYSACTAELVIESGIEAVAAAAAAGTVAARETTFAVVLVVSVLVA